MTPNPSSDTWVLLRGLTREAGHWGGFVAQLQARLPNARVVCVDLPGSGAHHRGASPWRIAPMVESVRQDLTARGLAPPYRLLALSLGGMVALDWATRRPDEVAGAVLVNTSLAGLSPLHHRLRPAAWPALAGWAVGALHREATILRLTSAGPDDHADALSQWAAIRAARPVSTGNAWRQLIAAARYRAPLQKPRVPLLLLAGAADSLVDTRCSLALARRWAVPLVMHPSAGHDLPLDDGPWVAEQVAAWRANAMPPTT
ncbi:alpha/beta fold hydrolase [Ideonella sp. YS5]|uniref:alpha/beta fold hydrolase n=1 Tax=Ideonella sp. YS5 TaxID=3453714 RepID=UPI003EEA67FF